MGWLATLHGDVSHLDPDHAAAAEQKVSDALAGVAGALAEDGHQGIAATFHGTTTGDVNLLEPGETPDAGPGTATPADAAQPDRPGEIPVEAAPDAEQAGGPEAEGVPPGQAVEPTGPADAGDAESGAESAQDAAEGQAAS